METENKSRISKLKEGLKYHLVDSTALLTSSTPVYAAMEVGIVGMSDQVSLGSRLSGAVITYGGIGWAFAKGRDLSRRFFSITDKTRERIQTLHDSLYTAVFNGVMTPPLYLAMGADTNQAIFGGLSAAALSIPMGPVLGYSVDVARDMTGLRTCERPSVKKGLAALLLAGSIVATAGVYALTPDENPQVIETPKSK